MPDVCCELVPHRFFFGKKEDLKIYVAAGYSVQDGLCLGPSQTWLSQEIVVINSGETISYYVNNYKAMMFAPNS